ncbi:hypothetical protein HJC23_012830 [Cyclotella cryptica]|uniref:Plastid lipid-associated protein/fibrillin conserved domain-containing protein n=1 Tax=Cyclotella cryptica TaxID=29204 RepID=A0ABD3NZS8_9STRA|eukprot:CCRYP_018800-RA/>CCRYP_018800-RA protein AED:0.00 eAED:0.00 QI:162/-1/1/1/-1/1/1/114/345
MIMVNSSIRNIRNLLLAIGVATSTDRVSGTTDSAFIVIPKVVPTIKSTRSRAPLCSTITLKKSVESILFSPLPFLRLSNDPNRNQINNTPAKSTNTGPKNESTLRNEFSRTIRVTKWFSSMGGSGLTSNRSSSTKSVSLNISATEPEREALATRFRLSKIISLTADLVVQPAFGMEGGGRNEENCCIEARGTVSAQVKQTCVRTNEDFDVDLEFNFDTTLKAMAATNAAVAPMSEGEIEALNAAAILDDRSGRSKKKKGGKRQNEKRVKGIKGGQSTAIDALGMEQLQNILMEYEVTSDIIEDESCFCMDGIVDVGEIVSQMFRSKLDPYPKKPGSNPVKYTFTF